FYVHRAKVVQGTIEVGSAYRAAVDAELRGDTARNHTATHLLHAILREVLGDHVKQAGSLVAPDRLRFDFTHFAPLTAREIDRIEARVNQRIRQDAPVQTLTMEIRQAIETGAMALFGEKYGEEVRVVNVADFSRELCGGTHCHGVGEIGLFKILRESSVAAGIRRIEAVTGPAAYEWIKGQEQGFRRLSDLFKSRPDDVVQKAERLIAQLQDKEREIERLRTQALSGPASDPIKNARKIGNLSLVVQKIPPAEIKEIRAQADRLRDRLKSGVVIVGAVDPKGEKATLVAMVTPDWTGRFSAAEIVKEMAVLIEGTGGGKAEMAQAGGKGIEKLDAALEKSSDIVQAMDQRK
ncbi:MAG TPA: DHHA1 domain-containing protein, partial [Candidatus Manganitrophaceae bacterium]